MVGAGVVVWWLVLGPVVARDRRTAREHRARRRSHTRLGDTMVLFALLVALLGRLTETPRTVLVLLAIGLVAQRRRRSGLCPPLARRPITRRAPGPRWSTCWSGSCHGHCGRDPGHLFVRGPLSGAKPRSLRPITLLPYLAIVAVYVPLGVSSFTGDGSDRVLVAGAIVATALVVGRQVYTARQNASLMTQRASARAAARFQALIKNALGRHPGDRSERADQLRDAIGRAALRTWPGSRSRSSSHRRSARPGRGPDGAGSCSAPPRPSRHLRPVGLPGGRPRERWVEMRVSNLLDDSLVSGPGRHHPRHHRAARLRAAARGTGPPRSVDGPRQSRPVRATASSRRSSARDAVEAVAGVLYLDIDDFKRINDTARPRRSATGSSSRWPADQAHDSQRGHRCPPGERRVLGPRSTRPRSTLRRWRSPNGWRRPSRRPSTRRTRACRSICTIGIVRSEDAVGRPRATCCEMPTSPCTSPSATQSGRPRRLPAGDVCRNRRSRAARDRPAACALDRGELRLALSAASCRSPMAAARRRGTPAVASP